MSGIRIAGKPQPILAAFTALDEHESSSKVTCSLLAAVAIGTLLHSQPAFAADDWKPVICESAKTYHGKKLHSPPAKKVFQDAGESITGKLDVETVTRLEKALEKALVATGAPEMSVAVAVPGKGSWSTNRMQAGGSSQPASQQFWFASVGKAFTAVVVLQLVEERKLSLDDKLVRWFPDFPNARFITIDHLLTHTSGIFSFQNDSKLRATPGYKSPERLIAVAREHGNGFCPGEYWSYSNTGYVMLGRIIEAIEGRPFHEVLTSRVIKRLGLKNTNALSPEEKLDGIAKPHPSKPQDEPVEDSAPTTPFAAGNVVATASDMIEFWHALLGGRILKPETVRDQFQRLYPMFDNGTFYGRGVMLYDVPDRDDRRLTWLGHSGGAPGFKAIVAYSVDAKAFVAVALNNDGSAEATANLLLKALTKAP
ncbi:MAG: beta-lactamase family protein [Verrucomicrobia bacterium]|nr:beta-lactamase family protein [Verrucomicrobiota bacterium]